ncbi:Predicted arabinose efflux permease, MFS family [Lentzea xinjiangensis]|uniref:Predicted arabinose efflux permease, MFS family n=1 Tax=Lentzea xinjiangensis TaxID=402600 RepID=A0A1H9K3N8_9PSEU|nr:Predicted arabinose efflux permease, MFS family [Lentzea xinjiangensis]
MRNPVDHAQDRWYERHMWRYLWSAGLARLADEMVLFALVLLVADRTGSVLLTALTTAGYTLPAVVTGPVLGAWLDRTGRPLLALAGNQFLLAGTALCLVFVPPPGMPLLAVLAGLALPMTSGGFTGMLPRLGVDLPRVTAYDSVLFSATAIVGPALAGGIAFTWSPAVAMVAVCLLGVLGGLCTLRLVLGPAPVSSHPSLVLALRAGARHLVRTAPLRAATVASVLSFAGFGMLVVALPWLVESTGADRSLGGVVMAVLDVGCVISVLALRPHLPRWLPERVLFVTIAAFGVALVPWAFAETIGWLLAFALLAGLVQGPALTSLITARQRYSPPELLGQVSTTGASLKIGAFSLGALLTGLLPQGPGVVVLVVAACQLVAVAAGLVSGRATRAPVP